VITGHTSFIAHIGFPTFTFKSPMIYNPYFESIGVNTIVVPFACEAQDYPDFLKSIFKMKNIKGALITMPHKVATLALLDHLSPAVQIAGACNAVRVNAAGELEGDMFDGEGFVRGLKRKGFEPIGRSALVVGNGGVGSAIAASLAKAGIEALRLFDIANDSCIDLGQRLLRHYPKLKVTTGSNNPSGADLVVNATPLGMRQGDALPIDISKLSSASFVGEVVLSQERTAFLEAASARGCRVLPGEDMLFEQIPAYLEFFGLPTTTPARLRDLAQLAA
jgi:shikimate dehydrogenase